MPVVTPDALVERRKFLVVLSDGGHLADAWVRVGAAEILACQRVFVRTGFRLSIFPD